MSKYYLDTEFNEDFTRPFLGKKHHFIDLISIGIVGEDNREYYAVSKDFNLRRAWNKWQWEVDRATDYKQKYYWLRKNVLFPIFKDLKQKELADYYKGVSMGFYSSEPRRIFCYRHLKALIKRYGKSNKDIAREVVGFVHLPIIEKHSDGVQSYDDLLRQVFINDENEPHEFYGYYADYDWVLLCSLFGTMMDLPIGFPMYCNDLKQDLETLIRKVKNDWPVYCFAEKPTTDQVIDFFENSCPFPKQAGIHHALADAKWNNKLGDFIYNF